MFFASLPNSKVYHKSTGSFFWPGFGWLILTYCGRDIPVRNGRDTRPRGKRLCKGCKA